LNAPRPAASKTPATLDTPGRLRITPPVTPPASSSALFPYRVRPGQDLVISEVQSLAHRGGALLLDAAPGAGKTVAALAPLLEHAEARDHRIVYLVRTHAQEVQVLTEARAIALRADRPILTVSLEGRQGRCLLLEGVAEMRGATAEEFGKLCGDRKRTTQRSFQEGASLVAPAELPESGTVDLTDLDGCPYYARVLQSDVEALADRFSRKMAVARGFEEYCRTENLCPYELAKLLTGRARLVTAPYVFFFHPHIRSSLLSWLGVGLDRVDLVIDEAHNLPDHLRDLSTVALPLDSVRRARAEVAERGDFALDDGVTATGFFERVASLLTELVQTHAPEEDGLLPPRALEDGLLTEFGGTTLQLTGYLEQLASWGETLREERRRERRLPRSWAHTVALTLLGWPELEPPEYVKAVTREPRRAVEAYALDAAVPAAPIRECHLSIHMSGTLAPFEEYRDALGLPLETQSLSVPFPFPPENRRLFYDAEVTTRFEEVRANPRTLERLADRIAGILELLPVKTAVFFPSFQLMDRVLAAGLAAQLPRGAVVESRTLSMGDPWRLIDGFKRASGAGALLGVAGGRIAEGIDFPEEALEAVVLVGVPFPKPTARRNALRQFLDEKTPGRGWEYAVRAPAQRAILQSLGRMIRSAHDRGIGVILDRRATQFADALPGLAALTGFGEAAREFYGRRTRLRWTRAAGTAASPAGMGSDLGPRSS
jgi:DNA excision repair protein ERCC-2